MMNSNMTCNRKFLSHHSPSTDIIELEACLTGFGGIYAHWIYHLPVPLNYRQMNIVHFEMINIVLALRLIHKVWKGKRVLIKCDNAAVVSLLRHGKTKDPFPWVCARNLSF